MTDDKYFQFKPSFPKALEPLKGEIANLREITADNLKSFHTSGFEGYMSAGRSREQYPDYDKAQAAIIAAYERIERWATDDSVTLESAKAAFDDAIEEYGYIFPKLIDPFMQNTRDQLDRILKYEQGVTQAVDQFKSSNKIPVSLKDKLVSVLNRADMQALGGVLLNKGASGIAGRETILGVIAENIDTIYAGTNEAKIGRNSNISIDLPSRIARAWDSLHHILSLPEVHNSLSPTTIDMLNKGLQDLIDASSPNDVQASALRRSGPARLA